VTKPKQPSTANVPVSWSGQEKRFGDSIKENMDVIVGQRGDPLNKAVTFGDLLDSGIGKLAAGVSSFSGNGQDVQLGNGNNASTGNDGEIPDDQLPIPSIIISLSATAGLNTVLLTMDWPIYAGHAYVEIWRNTADDITTASIVGTTGQASGLYSDPVSSANATYYYWVRAVNRINDKGPYNDNTGTSVTTAVDVDRVLDILSGQITSSELATSLADPIGAIPALQGQYSVKIDNNGHVAGFGLSNTTTTAGPTSAFIIRADRFAIIDPSSTADGLGTTTPSSGNVPFVYTPAGSAGGESWNAGVYMNAAYIREATITSASIVDGAIENAKIGNLNAGKITTGTLDASNVAIVGVNPTLSLKSSATGARLEMASDLIQVFDANNVARVKIGNI
jgi:hypothetical protein